MEFKANAAIFGEKSSLGQGQHSGLSLRANEGAGKHLSCSAGSSLKCCPGGNMKECSSLAHPPLSSGPPTLLLPIFSRMAHLLSPVWPASLFLKLRTKTESMTER